MTRIDSLINDFDPKTYISKCRYIDFSRGNSTFHMSYFNIVFYFINRLAELFYYR